MRTYFIYHKKSHGRPSGHICATGLDKPQSGYTKIGEIEANNKEEAYNNFIASKLAIFEYSLATPKL